MCMECPESFSLRSILVQHVKKVHFKLGRAQCEICDASLCTKDALRGHKRSVHGQSTASGNEKINVLECNKCDYSAPEQKDLRAHFKKLHMEPKPIKCPQCPTCFTIKSSVRTHIKTMHKGIKRHKCPRCNFRARYSYQLDKHKASCQKVTNEHEKNVSDSPKKEQDNPQL